MELDEKLHTYLRLLVSKIDGELDRKQLRYNDIVETAKKYYNDPFSGVKELVESCYKTLNFIDNPLYVHKQPMYKVLEENYSWMIYET